MSFWALLFIIKLVLVHRDLSVCVVCLGVCLCCNSHIEVCIAFASDCLIKIQVKF